MFFFFFWRPRLWFSIKLKVCINSFKFAPTHPLLVRPTQSLDPSQHHYHPFFTSVAFTSLHPIPCPPITLLFLFLPQLNICFRSSFASYVQPFWSYMYSCFTTVIIIQLTSFNFFFSHCHCYVVDWANLVLHAKDVNKMKRKRKSNGVHVIFMCVSMIFFFFFSFPAIFKVFSLSTLILCP
jgi:hypothetical protein